MFAIYSSDFLEFRPAACSRTFSELHGIDRATVNRVLAGIWFPRACEFENSCGPKLSDLRQRTKAFGLQILSVFCELPKTTEPQVLGKQLLRSGTSVGANYREAYRARSRAEFIAKCGDSLRELEETAYWLELLVDGNIVTADRLSTVRRECDELIAIFVTILKRSKEAPIS